MRFGVSLVLAVQIAFTPLQVVGNVTVTVDDFYGLNSASGNDLAITKSESGIELKMGPGTSSLGRDAFGTGTSTFGQSGAWFDGSYAKFGNSGNQQMLDFRITNNTGKDAKLTDISFDIRKGNSNANPTDYQLLYLATGDSALIKGDTVTAGSEMVNLVGLGAGTISGGINNFSNTIGANIGGTAWIADGAYANIRLKINTTNASAASQLDNFSVTLILSAAVCMGEGTLIATDRGEVEIEHLTQSDTIDGQSIVDITKQYIRATPENQRMVEIPKDALGAGVPNKDTFLTDYHMVYHPMYNDGKGVQASQMVDEKAIRYVGYEGHVYNILFQKYGRVRGHNMTLGTLPPAHRKRWESALQFGIPRNASKTVPRLM